MNYTMTKTMLSYAKQSMFHSCYRIAYVLTHTTGTGLYLYPLSTMLPTAGTVERPNKKS